MLGNALKELLQEKSFEDISVQDLAERSTVNRATFYDHFADKYALLEASISDRFQCEISKRMGEAKATCPEAQKQIILTICSFLAEVSSGCQKHQRQFQPLLETQVKSIVREFLLVGLREQKIEPAEAELRATLASWAIVGAALEWCREKKTTPEVLAETILPLIRPALVSCPS